MSRRLSPVVWARRKSLVFAAALVGLALLAGACANGEQTLVRAVFDDVADLTPRGVVKIADVPVGTVRSIELTDDYRAMVTMAVTSDVALPARLSAELRKTAVLGERYVNLIPHAEAGGAWESGDVVTETRFVPELEELVRSGSELLAAVSADRIAGAIEAGAIGLGGRGPVLGQLLDDVAAVVAAYDTNSEDLVRLVDGFDGFLADAGPRADLHGRSLQELTRLAAMLREEDDRLLDTLTAIRRLSQTGTDIMRTHRARFDRFFQGWRQITDELVGRGDDLDRLFFEVAKHNHNTIRGVNAEHAQVLLDFLICGFNEEPGDPVRSCDDPPQGQPRPEPPPRMDGSGGGSP